MQCTTVRLFLKVLQNSLAFISRSMLMSEPSNTNRTCPVFGFALLTLNIQIFYNCETDFGFVYKLADSRREVLGPGFETLGSYKSQKQQIKSVGNETFQNRVIDGLSILISQFYCKVLVGFCGDFLFEGFRDCVGAD